MGENFNNNRMKSKELGNRIGKIFSIMCVSLDWAIEIDTLLAREKGCAKHGSFLLRCVIYSSNKIFKISDLP